MKNYKTESGITFPENVSNLITNTHECSKQKKKYDSKNGMIQKNLRSLLPMIIWIMPSSLKQSMSILFENCHRYWIKSMTKLVRTTGS